MKEKTSVMLSAEITEFKRFRERVLEPQHDAINHIFSFAGKHEVRLGRFLLPV